MMEERSSGQAELRERVRLLVQLDAWLEKPLLVLAFVWLGLFLIEVLYGLSPVLVYAGYAIWAVFALEFVVEIVLAPNKRRYLARNWLKLIALAAPGLRLLRIARLARAARAARAARSARLIRVLSSVNRGLRALRSSMQRRGFGFVLLSTLLVTIAGAAGMFAFESREHDQGFGNFGDALWWTAMLMTSLGSEFWPRTPEGRLLGLLLSLYAVAVFGYVTATLAAFFIGRDSELLSQDAGRDRELLALRGEIAELRAALQAQGRAPGAPEAE